MGNKQAEQVRIDVEEIKRETDAAILVLYNDEDVWIPLSQVHSIHRDPDRLHLYVTPWIAKQKGLV